MKEEILKFFKGDIENDKEILKKYSHDASIFEIMPELVLFPKNSDDVKNLVKWAGENKVRYPKLSITARCAGTDMSGGSIGESIILDFTRYMNKLIDFDFESKRITVEPGMFYRDFEKITLEKKLLLPSYTASKDLCAVGGMVANNSGGEKNLLYGKTEEYIESLDIVFSDGNEYTIKALSLSELQEKIAQNNFEGNIYKKILDLINNNKEKIDRSKPNVTKNSAGYYIWNVLREDGTLDLNRLLVGSQGTLGIITQITFKLIKPKEFSKLLVVFLRDINTLPNLVNIILKHKPETLESYDDKTFFLVLKYIIDFIKLLGLKNLFKLIFSFWPETLMTLQNGFPRLILLIEFTGDSENEVFQKAQKAISDLNNIKNIGIHLTKNDFEAKKYWTIRHEAFNLIRYHLKNVKSKPFIDDVIVKPERLPEFFPELYKILNKYKKDMTFALGGHCGDGNLHIYTLLNPKNPNLTDIIMNVSEAVYDLVARLDGSITAEHNDGIIRTPFLEKMYGAEVILIFKEIKNIFDPKDIFNTGKKVGATKEYIKNHISKV